jgi:hypothetical protein
MDSYLKALRLLLFFRFYVEKITEVLKKLFLVEIAQLNFIYFARDLD